MAKIPVLHNIQITHGEDHSNHSHGERQTGVADAQHSESEGENPHVLESVIAVEHNSPESQVEGHSGKDDEGAASTLFEQHDGQTNSSNHSTVLHQQHEQGHSTHHSGQNADHDDHEHERLHR